MITLESDRLRVALDPAFGARVTALWDKHACREWLVQGPSEGDPGDGAIYGKREARGWDECFPTVSPCEHPQWGSLRDHGLLWGRPWAVTACGTRCDATYREDRFEFRRSLELQDSGLTARYSVINLAAEALPFLWSQHCLLAPRPGERIALEGLAGFTDGDKDVRWPLHRSRDLSVVGAISDGFAQKLYAMDVTHTSGAASATLMGEDGGLKLTWTDVPSFGLWLDYGGWPPDGPLHQVALEPTTSPFGDLCQAQGRGLSGMLAPGMVHRWAVQMSLVPGSRS